VRELHSKADWKNFDRMEKAIKQLAVKLPRFPTAKQISAVDAKARKFNFKTTRDHIENELDFFLTRAGRQPEHAPAFKASPWCNHFANEQHIFEQPGTNLPYKLYPHDPNMRLVLGSVISEFGSFEISRGVSPELSQLFAVQRGLTQFDKATRSLPIESPILKAFRETEPKLREFSAMLQAEINRRVSEPAAFFTPLRVRRLQHAFYYAVLPFHAALDLQLLDHSLQGNTLDGEFHNLTPRRPPSLRKAPGLCACKPESRPPT
jgi:hypothetical protein